MAEPTPGFADMLSDAEDTPITGEFIDIEVERIGVISARKTKPRSTAALAMMASPRVGQLDSVGYANLFLIEHLDEGQYDDLVWEMMSGAAPHDAMQEVVRAIAIQGTGRPFPAVMSLAVTTAHHWRQIRSLLMSDGIDNPMSLPSMHMLLDRTEKAALEGIHKENERKAFLSKLYRSENRTHVSDKPKPPPAWFSEAEMESGFDQLLKLSG